MLEDWLMKQDLFEMNTFQFLWFTVVLFFLVAARVIPFVLAGLAVALSFAVLIAMLII